MQEGCFARRNRVMLAAMLTGIAGCAAAANRPGPRTLGLDYLQPVACSQSSAALEEWPATRVTFHAPADQVLVTARELLRAYGYQMAVESPRTGCLQTAYEPVSQSRWESLRAILTAAPPLTARSLVVHVEHQDGVSVAAVSGIAKFSQLGLRVGDASVRTETRRIARALRRSFRGGGWW